MRQIGRHLEELLEALGVHLIAHQRQEERQREGDQNRVDADDQRILDRIAEHVGAEVPLKVLEARPRAAHDALSRLEILECDDHTIHRHIGKADEDDDRGQHQQIQPPVALDSCPGAALAQAACLCHDTLSFSLSCRMPFTKVYR